jgi:indolepyruvate ferredoxin oxidoreductase beta subunit
LKHDIIIAGVGGQGILTIARLISMTAAANGLQVKQAEVHGMSQRGGAVYSHLRISDSEIFSDLIPAGQAQLIISIEPLEAIRYVSMLNEGGAIVSSTNAEVNIPDYPRIEGVLDHVAGFPHIAINMEKLARAAGSVLAANVVALGAASAFLSFSADQYEQAITALFNRKGQRIVDANLRAFRFGRATGAAYLDAIQRGAEPQSIRGWIDTLSPELLATEDELEFTGFEALPDRLSGAEAHAFENLLLTAYNEGRRQLYEHEVYRLVELVGAISPPRHTFIPKGSSISAEALQNYPGDRVVLKLVSEDIVHKSDAKAVTICPKNLDVVCAEIDSLVARHSGKARVAGTLLVEFVEHDSRGLGGELFVGIRGTREFGPVIAAGLGGLDTEYLAAKMKPGIAVAKAVATDTSAEEFLELFKKTAAYEILSGSARGHERVVSDGELLRCFRAFISIARIFCVDRGEAGPDIGELEVNPFAFSRHRLVPLDGRGRLRPAVKPTTARPPEGVAALLQPKSMALVGVSAKPEGFGRIILANTVKQGYDKEHLYVVKKDVTEVDGIRCVESITALPEQIDLLVITAPSSAVPGIVEEANGSGKVKSVIVISGAAGETDSSQDLGKEISAAIDRGRTTPEGGVVVLGPNCMGVQSAPGKYDTFFIPEAKLATRTGPADPVAFISQSGAFIVSRLSSMDALRPAFSISLGNQMDVTVSDILWSLASRDDVQVAGIYLEGFADLDGLETLRAVQHWIAIGKTVVFYKAGRNEGGRSAAAGHTAAVAGDYEICDSALRHAGAIVATDFRQFGQLLEMSTLLAGRKVQGGRIFAITNAGMEAVGMADALGEKNARVSFPSISEPFEITIRNILAVHKLETLVSPRNPLDLTPMAGETCYAAIVRAALKSDEVDAVIVSCVPMAPQLHTLESELDDATSFVKFAPEWLKEGNKPLVFVIDSGSLYDALASRLRNLGLPVFCSADEAAKCLARWLENRLCVETKAPRPGDAPLLTEAYQ